MKAYSLYGIGDLRYVDIDKPQLPAGWALVEIKTCGICSSDIPRIFTKGTYAFPTVPGHEFSGIVVKTAERSDAAWIGKRVSVFPLIPCGECEQCKHKHYEMCEHYNYLGSRCNGGMAEYAAVPVWNLIELNDATGFEEGALFEPLSVALHCVNRASLCGGESVAVIGSGTIAFAVGQWAKVKGADKVFIIGRSDYKKRIADKMGLRFAVDSDVADTLFDVVIEAVGSQTTLRSAIEHAAAGGKVVLMGNPEGDMLLPQNVYWRILRKQLHISGTWNSSYDGRHKSEWYDVRNALSENAINTDALISHRFDQTELVRGLEIMRDYKEPYCKIMTLWNK